MFFSKKKRGFFFVRDESRVFFLGSERRGSSFKR